jgi:hypothetical protein
MISFNNVWLKMKLGISEKISTLFCVIAKAYTSPLPDLHPHSAIRQPLVKLPVSWREFVKEDIKIIRHKSEFNMKLKKYLISELSDVPICNRLLCPACLRIA